MVTVKRGTVFYGDVKDFLANDNVQTRVAVGREVRGSHSFITIASENDFCLTTPVFSKEASDRLRIRKNLAYGGWIRQDSFVHPRQVWLIPSEILSVRFVELGSYAANDEKEINRLHQNLLQSSNDSWRAWHPAA